jgi:sugar transferase (PEP-CTERM system associated)
MFPRTARQGAPQRAVAEGNPMIRIFSHYVSRQAFYRALFDLVALVAAMWVAFMVFDGRLEQFMPKAGTHMLSLAAGMFLINTATGFYGSGNRLSLNQACARAAVALVVALPLTYLLFGLLPADLASREALRMTAMAGVAAVVLRRLYVSYWGGQSIARSRIMVFGSGSAAQLVGATLKSADPNAHVVGFVPGPNEREAAVPADMILQPQGRTLAQTAHDLGVDEIVVALTERRSGSMPLRQLLDCKLSGVKVYDIATHFEKTLGQIRIDYVNAGWLIFGSGFNQGLYRTLVKRLFDLACALLLILLSLPVMLVTALLIKLESKGPVLYRQERVGLNGETFMVNKFRSMRTDAEKDGKPVWAQANDNRVTRVGAIIRRLRIDELPQLFNVLNGEMSLVGPRPERPFFVEQLTQQIPYFAARHSVKPGVTGWAQVRYQYGSTIEDAQEKLQYDLYYVKNHTLFLDIVVLFETVFVVLTGKGAR